MRKKILGLDLGSNSVGWALLEEKDGKTSKIIDIGSRVFNKAVKETVPTPKNQNRREKRLGRRVLQRRARRKQKMLNYLVTLDLLPKEVRGNFQPEIILNELGNPYELRARGLDERLSRHELGRVLLHFVARRGFLSNKKQSAGDLIDDPDMADYFADDSQPDGDMEETQFKEDIKKVHQEIKNSDARTLGEWLHKLARGECKRNRNHAKRPLRTERVMYQQEWKKIWETQKRYFFELPGDFFDEIEKIIFHQRPIKFKKNRVGKCSLERKKYRTNMARLEAQQFRYLQDINHLKYLDRHSDQWLPPTDEQKRKLIDYFEYHQKITTAAIKKQLGVNKFTQINLDDKNLKGNITACKIRSVIGGRWDEMDDDEKRVLFEDLFTIKKKSALKNRLMAHWHFDVRDAIELCLLEFEASHSNHSLKAINKMLPYLERGDLYSDARTNAGYGYEAMEIDIQDKLPNPPGTANPIVNKGLYELKRVVNAVINEYGKPDAVRIEMARDLEMNTRRYKEYIARQKKNEKANKEAESAFTKETGRSFASGYDKIKYRLWKDQNERCAYSNKTICMAQVFSAETEVDHILPYRKSLDNSYMNKVICFAAENRNKSDCTPIDAWGGNSDKWNQITQAINKWGGKGNSLKSKIARFYQTNDDLQKRDFINAQLNDTRYISKVAQEYVKNLGCDVSVTKGYVVSGIRRQWGFDTLLGEREEKDRSDHRHHAIDAVVIAATSRSLYQKAVTQINGDKFEVPKPYENIRRELAEHITHTIVSHTPKRKLSGSLHEDTGAGYIDKHGGLVYRKTLNSAFTDKNVNSIVDETVKSIVKDHISRNNNNIKEAFADGKIVRHKDGKTPIKRVRVLQSRTTVKKLEQNKFGVKDKSGNVFRWMVYGNNHHVEIIRHKETEKIKGKFVSMMLASHRAKGIGMEKQPMVKVDHGKEYEFLMALHINDTISIRNKNGERIFYRVQVLGSDSNRILFRLATATTLNNRNDQILMNINKKNFEEHDICFHRINAIGHPIND